MKHGSLLRTFREVLTGAYTHLEHRTFSMYWQARARHVLSALSLHSDDSVLDLGCGAGLWTSWIAPRTRRMLAIDTRTDAIQAARRWRAPRPPRCPTASAHWCVASGEHVPFPDACCTKALVVDVMDVVPDDRATAAELYRILTFDGVVVVTNLLKNRQNFVARIEPQGALREYETESLCDLLQSAGFSIKRVFYFYYFFGMATRELQTIAEASRLRRVPIVLLLVQAVLSLAGRLDLVVPIGSPSGVGVVACKVPESSGTRE